MQKISQTINSPSIANRIDRMYKLRKKLPKFPRREKTFLELWDFLPKMKSVPKAYNCFLFINKLNHNPSFGSYPPEGHSSEAILRDLHPTPSVRLGSSSGASCIHLLRFVSDYPPTPHASISFGSSRIILRRLNL